tara:strand:+ start:1190 stop:2434 length:1245 start_codon:yes stop_codon:yes gene_type:complete
VDFDDSNEEAAFRAEARGWLEANIPTKDELSALDELGKAQFWQKRKSDAGWACIHWPTDYGGRGGSTIEEVIFNQEEGKLLPNENRIFQVNHGLVGPTLMSWATEENKRRFIPRIVSGEDIWCQLFSEPAAGSDMAALRTRAVKHGEEWLVNGQKIWTTGAQHASWGILVVRTDPAVPKHKGLTYFYVDMSSPGIECKPIKEISGGSDFNEVYFTDVRIPDSQRLGDVGQGWQVSISTLMHERASSLYRGGRPSILSQGGRDGFFQRLKQLAKTVHVGKDLAINDARVRANLASWYVLEAGLKFTSYRALSALSRGEMPGPEASIGKLVGASFGQDLASFAIDLLEQEGVIRDPSYNEQFGALFQDMYMYSPSGRIAGGTDEILIGVIAERVLGLPQEPRVDKDVPFNDVPVGA